MAINIFEYPYKTEENIWTASLIKTLSNTDVTVINKFFAEIGLAFRIKKMKEVNFDMQVHEEENVPDAVLEGQNKSFIIGIEVKKLDTLDVGQIKKHLESYINKEHKEKCFLIITNHYSKPKEIRELDRQIYKRIKISYISWRGIKEFANKQIEITKNMKNKYLLQQFIEFIDKNISPLTKWSGFSPTLLQDWVKFYRFQQEIRKLVEDEIVYFVNDSLKDKEIGKGTEEKMLNEKVGYIEYSWSIKTFGFQYANLCIGFYGHEDEDSYLYNPTISLELWWNKNFFKN
jgi:hypothetical protein